MRQDPRFAPLTGRSRQWIDFDDDELQGRRRLRRLGYRRSARRSEERTTLEAEDDAWHSVAPSRQSFTRLSDLTPH